MWEIRGGKRRRGKTGGRDRENCGNGAMGVGDRSPWINDHIIIIYELPRLPRKD